jgi:hypothetical protein
MRWPPDHPARRDPRISAWLGQADELCGELFEHTELGPVLRHVPGRRIAVRVSTPDGDRVLKIFGGPRARGNHHRLTQLAASGAREVVPGPCGADSSGHVCLIDWVEGTPLDLLGPQQFVASCYRTGRALAMLHRSGVQFDRCWTVRDELAQLERRATSRTSALLDPARRMAEHLADRPLLSAHRDLEPRQVVVAGGRVRMIDLNDAAMAPAALDVGNFLAHLEADVITGRLPARTSRSAARAFRSGYGTPPADLAGWKWLMVLRLAGLAETRHHRPDWAKRLLHLVEVGAGTAASPAAL